MKNGQHAEKKRKVVIVITVIAVLLCVAFGITYMFKASNTKKYDQVAEQFAQYDFGAQLPQICYVDSDSVILYDSHGILVFDLEAGKLCGFASFEDTNLGDYMEGDNATFVYASDDGKYVYAYTMQSEKYLYDVSDDEIKIVDDYGQMESSLWQAEKYEGNIVQADAIDSVSEIYPCTDDGYCYLGLERTNVELNYSDLRIVVNKGGVQKIYPLFAYLTDGQPSKEDASSTETFTAQEKDTQTISETEENAPSVETETVINSETPKDDVPLDEGITIKETCTQISHKMTNEAFKELQQQMTDAYGGIYRHENFAMNIFSEQEQKNGLIWEQMTVSYDRIPVREVEDDPFIVGMAEARNELTDSEKIAAADKVMEGWLIEMEGAYHELEHEPRCSETDWYIVFDPGSENYTIFHRGIYGDSDKMILLEEYSRKFWQEDAEARKEQGRARLLESLE